MHHLTLRKTVAGTLTVLALALIAAAAPATADVHTYAIDPAHSEAAFQIRHMFTNVRGTFGDFEGTVVMDTEDPASSTVSFTIDAASIDTDHEERDAHLRTEDFFWVEKHPEITFVSESIRPVGDNRYAVTGTFTLRGVSKKITLPVTFLGAGQDPWGNTRAGFSTETSIDRKEYGMVWNANLDQGGYILGDDVEIEVNLETIEQTPKADAEAEATR